MSKLIFLKKVIHFISDLLYPAICFGCGKEGDYLCLNCFKKLIQGIKFVCPICEKPSFCGKTCLTCQKKTHLNGLVFIAPYQNQLVQKLIHSFKYELAKGLAKPLASLMAKTILDSELKNLFLKDDWLIVPIPLHLKKLRERGFNQAELLAKEISQETKIPFGEKVLIKIKNTLSQTTLQEKERKENIKGVFDIKNINLLKNKNVILVDDVTTTSATLEEAAKILKRAGVKLVWGLTLARG